MKPCRSLCWKTQRLGWSKGCGLRALAFGLGLNLLFLLLGKGSFKGPLKGFIGVLHRFRV